MGRGKAGQQGCVTAQVRLTQPAAAGGAKVRKRARPGRATGQLIIEFMIFLMITWQVSFIDLMIYLQGDPLIIAGWVC